MDKNAKVIKGLSIATIVLSALSIIGLLIVVGLISWAGSMMNDPNVARYLLDDYTYGYGHSYDSYLEGVVFVTGGLSIAVALVFIDVIFHAFVLVTGIMGLRHSNESEKLNVTFICAIISACLCLIGGGWITMAVLLSWLSTSISSVKVLKCHRHMVMLLVMVSLIMHSLKVSHSNLTIIKLVNHKDMRNLDLHLFPL